MAILIHLPQKGQPPGHVLVIITGLYLGFCLTAIPLLQIDNRTTYPILGKVRGNQWRNKACSIAYPVRDAVQRSREVRSQVLMVDQVGQRGCAVGAHGERDQGHGEDGCAASVAQTDEQ